ncbi:MAG: L-histidine N(alpha)-methyltransferase [Okeania sp. SIO2F4]|nr:L-histidine N(alpha)-methyltransferase [Okeania sp. SIO2F4]
MSTVSQIQLLQTIQLTEQNYIYQEVIDHVPDYYPYKNEVELIGQVASSVAAYVSEDATIIEFEPGSKTAFRNKTLPLLKALGKAYKYVGVDLSETYLQRSLDIIKGEFTDVEIEAIKTEFIQNCSLVKKFKKPVVWFPDSTIGNLKPEDCLNFLKMIALELQPNGLLIAGIDGNQDRDSLRKAYYEHPKVRQFLLNIL